MPPSDPDRPGPGNDSDDSDEQSREDRASNDRSTGNDSGESWSIENSEQPAASGSSNSEQSKPQEMLDQQRAFLVACLDDPERASQRLPSVVSLVESDEKGIRILAISVFFLVAVESDDEQLVEYLVRRLSDRLTETGNSLELTTALDYLSSGYPELVNEIFAEIASESDSETGPLPEVGNFTRSYYYRTEPERAGIGRTRFAGEGVDEDPREAVADSQREERQRIEHERERESDDASRGDTDSGAERDQTEESDPEAMEQRTTEVSSIAVRSRFSELYVQGQRRSGRYTMTYEALVGDGGNQEAVALRLLHRPQNKSHLLPFEEALEETLRRWAAIGDQDHVLTLIDWGVEPQPWIATALSSESLADREDMDVVSALGNAIGLVDAVSYAHQNGIVHGALDPENVVFPGERLDRVTDQAPLVDNVGLIQVYREYFNPADHLDPRYAAPEYYSSRFGRVDHATDIYQLGAVIYRLFTNRPPHTGDFDRIRGAVLKSSPPPPSHVEDAVPEGIDKVISKAMAKQKIRRYETVEHLKQDLSGIADEYEFV